MAQHREICKQQAHFVKFIDLDSYLLNGSGKLGQGKPKTSEEEEMGLRASVERER